MTGSSDIPAPIIRLVHDAEPAETEGYRPWGTARDGEKPLFLDLRRADGIGEMIAYAYVMRIAYSGDSLVSLICAGGTAFTIEGQGLGELVHRLQAQEVAFMQEFDEKRWGQLSGLDQNVHRISTNLGTTNRS